MNEDEAYIKQLRTSAKKIRTWGSSEIKNSDLIKSLHVIADMTESRMEWFNKAKEL